MRSLLRSVKTSCPSGWPCCVPGRGLPRPGRLGLIWLIVPFLLCGAVGTAVAASDRLTPPPSHLNADHDAPVYLTGFLAFGGSTQYDIGCLGYGATFLFRPGSADRFLSFLYDAQLSMVLQADYQKLDSERHMLSADFILRHYLKDMTAPENEISAFFGAGLGASQIYLAPEDGGGADRNFSWLLEIGQEWRIRSVYVLSIKLQYRSYRHDGWDYSHLAVQAGAGIPLPW